VHGDSSERQALEALISDIPIEFPLIIADMGPTVGTHGGPGIIGVAWLEA
jgi:fatty acid-binding protein DegV